MDQPRSLQRHRVMLFVVLLLVLSLIISVALGVAWFSGLQQISVLL